MWKALIAGAIAGVAWGYLANGMSKAETKIWQEQEKDSLKANEGRTPFVNNVHDFVKRGE